MKYRLQYDIPYQGWVLLDFDTFEDMKVYYLRNRYYLDKFNVEFYKVEEISIENI